ncbi:uncharacterized protein yc1106_08913 [Curvularia clavata]|uniref:Zn(2)-C6 fungal-type domain-containing protein n=1 Tax=Curvularia clavata TaxID=95742 RepID=A0A9Q9DX78_CURCL|nr:uncharacterized protein yc1106_08913 [Curvularia clavata]
MAPRQSLDHLILFVPADPTTRLPRVPSYFSKNFTLTPGGFHADGATSNVLIILSDGCYIELISFVPDAPSSVVSDHWWGPSSTFIGWKDWCLTNSLPPSKNYEDVKESHGEPIHGGRKRADGVEVRWSVTFPKGAKGGQDTRGRVPFFCHDETPRGLRVPMDEEKTQHKCGAVGVKELTVVVKDRVLMERTRDEYEAILGHGGQQEKDCVRFRLGRVQEAPELQEDAGAEVVLRLPRNVEEETRVEEQGFWYGDVVLCRKAEPGKVEKTRERVDVEEDGVGGVWLEGSTGSAATGPYETQLKVAIPRLSSQRAPPPAVPKSRPRDRVPLACRNCHKRKIKCSGKFPRCDYCEKSNKPCVYERPRRDRLALANARNDSLTSILKDISLRSEDDSASSSLTLSSRASFSRLYQKHSNLLPNTSSVNHISGISTDSDQSPLPRVDGILPDESGDEEATDFFDVAEAGFQGQVSEVQWLQSLRSRVQAVEPVLLEPTNPLIPMTFPSSSILPPLDFTSNNRTSPIAAITYHLDDEGVKLIHGGNPFELPSEQTAGFLFQCYKRTVQSSFPILPAMLETQLYQYYNLIRNHQDIQCPQNWFAIINLVFAIGARFSHLVQADWRADTLDHVTYISRAYQLLAMGNSAFGLSTPDLSSTRAAGLLTIYYMSMGHYNRAWIMASGAMQSAFSLGLHVQQEDPSISEARQQSRINTWWSLHALESLLSSITGRPGTLPGEEITTPLSKAFFNTTASAHSQTTTKSSNMAFLDANSNLYLLTQQAMASLYTQRKLAPSWSRVQETMVALVGDLDKWAVDYVPQFHSENWTMDYEQQRYNSLLKLQYYRVKILTTRPSLRRIERCTESGSGDFTHLDQSMAEACIRAASDVVAILGTAPDIATFYEKGPWWTIVHNVMQALAILMNAIACPEHFADSSSLSAYGVRQLVGWLLAMRETNIIAARAHQVVYSLVKTSQPHIWTSIADAFPDDLTIVLLHPGPAPINPKYVPWPAEEQPMDAWFENDLNSFYGY